ncbi:MAG: glycosyltransferase family 2 protein [Candidatus Latescibacteria bacterium]|nr:glycosyltransferase family 2 protein [Candidatus Latescibacterota bacterium]
MQLSVVIPAYNEEEAIGEVIDGLQALFHREGIDGEVVVVDDGSMDRTGEIARSLNVTVVRHPQNAGYGASIMDGIRHARHETICITDADGTYPIQAIPELARYIDTFDMVVGARQGKHYRGSLLKHPARLIFLYLVQFATGTRIPDANSGLRMFKRNRVLPFFDSLCRGFSFTTTITLGMLSRGYFVKFVPIQYYARKGRSKVRLFKDSLRTAQIIVQALMYYNPIKAVLPLVLGLGFASLLCLVWYLIRPNLLAGIWAMLLFLGAVLVFVIGLLADLIAANRREEGT